LRFLENDRPPSTKSWFGSHGIPEPRFGFKLCFISGSNGEAFTPNRDIAFRVDAWTSEEDFFECEGGQHQKKRPEQNAPEIDSRFGCNGHGSSVFIARDTCRDT
jgi:hypothetical protein